MAGGGGGEGGGGMASTAYSITSPMMNRYLSQMSSFNAIRPVSGTHLNVRTLPDYEISLLFVLSNISELSMFNELSVRDI